METNGKWRGRITHTGERQNATGTTGTKLRTGTKKTNMHSMQVCHQPPTHGISHNSCAMRAFACGLKYNVWRSSMRYACAYVRMSRVADENIIFLCFCQIVTNCRIVNAHAAMQHFPSHKLTEITKFHIQSWQIRRCASRHCCRRCRYARCTRENTKIIIIITITAFTGDN